MATVFERWAQTASELKAAKATPEQVEAARDELRGKFVQKMKEAKLDDLAKSAALSRFEMETNALSVKHGIKKDQVLLSDEEKYAMNNPVLGGITQVGKEVVAPLIQGSQRIAGGVARLLNDIGDNEKGTGLDNFATTMEDAQKGVDEWAGKPYAEADGVRGFAKSALQNAPQIVASLIPGAVLGRAASLAGAARGAQASAKVLKYGLPVAAGLSFGQNYAGEYGDARQQTTDKLASATADDLRDSKEYGSAFNALERKYFDDGMGAEDAAKAARDYLVDNISENRAHGAAAINTALEFIAPNAMAVMPSAGKAGAEEIAKELAKAGKIASGGRLGSKAANLADLKDVGLQFLQEGLQGATTERVAEGARANAFNDSIDYGSVIKSGIMEGLAGGIIGGASQMAAGGTARQRAKNIIDGVVKQRQKYDAINQAATTELQRIAEIRSQRPLTEEEKASFSAATLEVNQSRAAIAEIDKAITDSGIKLPSGNPSSEDQSPAMDELRAAADQQPQEAAPAQPSPAPQEPASGLSGVVQRAQASTATDLTTVVNDAIASGQTPDFSALAQASNRDRSEVVDLFNRRRTLVDLADAGDLNGMRDMAARMTADPQEQQSLIEQAVAVRDKRRVMATQPQPQPTQQAEPQQPATPIKTPRDTAYEKMLADTEASLASGASDVDTFLAVRQKYAGNKDLVDTDINGVIDDAKASLSGKREVAAKREAAIESAIPHLKAGDEVSAVIALANAGITDDADIQAVFKEANSRLKAKPAAAQAKPQQEVITKSPMEQAVEAVNKAQEGGKGVKLATIAKKYGVSLVDLAKQVVAAKTAPINTNQPEERKASPVLALPAPKDAPVPADQPLVSRRGKLLPKAQADAMAEQSAAEKRDMRRAMSEEAGNPTGVPVGMRPRVEVPARKPQKAVLPDVILRTDGNPFPNEAEATRAMNRKGAQETHEVTPAPQGSGVVVKRKKANTIDAEKDDILAAIAKAGGVNWEQARKQGGFDPAESGRRGSGILRVFKKKGGMTLDGMAEMLSQYGYPVTDENGDYTVNALLDAIDGALRGGQIGTPQFNERLAREAYEQEAEMRALDDALDNTSTDMPSWLDDGVDNMISAADESDAVVAAIADVLSEAEENTKAEGELKNAWADWARNNKHSMGDELFIGGVNDGNNFDAMPLSLRRRQAHGMTKGGAGELSNLLSLLNNGIDRNRGRGGKEGEGSLDTANLGRLNSGSKSGSATGTSGGTAYRDGAFTLVLRDGVSRFTDIGQVDAIVVNSAIPDAVLNSLKSLYPNYRFTRSGDLRGLLGVQGENTGLEAHNEQRTGPVTGAGQETDTGAAPRGGEGGRAPAAEVRGRGQREGQADTRQGAEDTGREGESGGNWIGASRYFEKTLDNEYGPESGKSEAAAFARDAEPGTTILETIIRPSGKKTHLLHLVGADGERETAFVREGDGLDSVLPEMREKLKRREESLAQMKQKTKDEQDANRGIAKRNGFAIGVRLGDITPNTGKLLRSAIITADHGNGSFDVQGVSGNKQAVIGGMTAASIERAIDRAGGKDSFSLTAQTESERLAEEQRRAAAIEAQRKAEERDRQKAEADRDLSSFTLTGSDRPADVAMAAGQNDLFAPKTRGQKEAEKAATEKKAEPQASANTVFTEDAAAKARELLKSRMRGNRLNSGLDPEMMQAGITLAGYHIEKGARTFAAYAKAMIEDLGDMVKPYLKSWYMGVKYDPRAAGFDGMSSAGEVEAFDADSIDAETTSPDITPESLQDYVIEKIRSNVGAKYPGGEPPLVIREVESTDFSIGEILQAHPAVVNRREDPATYKKFAEAAKLVDNGVIRKAIIGTRDIAPFGSWPSRNTQEDQVNARDTGGTSSEPGGGNETPANKGVVLNEQRRTEHSDGFAGQSAGREVGSDATRGTGVSGGRAADGGKRGDQPVRGGFGQFQPAGDIAGSDGRRGGAESGDTRVPVDRAGSAAVVQAVGSVDPEVTRQKKLAAQRQAESIPVVPGDKENIDATLPFLLDGQREDILTAEKRFAAKNGHGMLFTNGTGTGKTFLALGTIKRFARQGKGNVLVVVPNDAVIKEWTTSAPALGLTINQLADTKDKGTGVSITTYANFGQNDAIAFRDYDLVVMDEAHNLMQNAEAGSTEALSTLRAITRHEDGIRRLTDMQNRDLVDAIAERSKKIFENGENLRGINKTAGTNGWKLKVETDRLEAELRDLRDQWEKAHEENKKKALSTPRPKALFLSATPFAYEKNVVWAQGYLFDWNEGKPSEENRTRAYNEPDNYERFMIQHFGYRMRYNKLTEPDAKVDRDLMQREFNATLRKSGSLSARMLDVPSDYQRAFALTPNALGTKIDEGLNWLREADNGKYRQLYEVIAKRFDYLSRQRLLEAMKAESAIPMIQKWHDLDKKVVVFYDFNEGGGFAPFNLGNYKPDGEDPQAFGQLVQDFYAARPDLKDLNTAELPSPLEALLSAFPNAGVYNGRVSKKKRAADMEAFNDDNNRDANLLIVQSAANAGWSAHDKSGKFKRVLINLGMPTAPTKAIQQEGRIYRQGQHPESDSMFVYMNTGTSWERAAFAGTIARRASTAENLAMGEQARGLRDAFIMAFEDSDILEPSLDEGKGSKEKDRSLLKAASPFDRAKSYYFGQLKKTQATKAREGKDYFATPEPVGMKMVEWLGLEGGEKALEPSAGHGAISRWFPDNTENTIVEPSFELISRAALNTNAKQINDSFENLNIVNKYHGIAMNPPFGVGGKTAMEHVDKAFRHLSDGGRIVALIPEGPAADRRFEEWLEAKDEKGKPAHPDVAIRATIRLPAATFERAGTAVRTRIVVIDRIKDDTARSNADSISIDLSQAGDINALFNRIENVSVPKRVTAGAATAADATPAAGGQDSSLLEAKETTHAIKKIPLYVAALTRRVDGDTYTAISRIAKRHGGYYSKFDKNGAIPGFQFESEEARGKFMEDAAGMSNPTTGVAEVGGNGEYIVNNGGMNERDAGSVQSRKRTYGSHSAEAHDDLFASAAVPETRAEAERNRTDFSKHFTTISENIEHGQVAAPEKIQGHAQAAALFSRWKDYSQERFIVAGMTEDGRVAEVYVHTVGLKASASVEPGIVAGMAARNPEIKSVWFAHNHPSGTVVPSAADIAITRDIHNLISAAGIAIDGHVIMGAERYSVLDGEGNALRGEFGYPARGAEVSVPMVDRMITKRAPSTKISGPLDAKRYVTAKGLPGIVLMDTQLNIVGFWEMSHAQMRNMRGNKDSTRSLMAAIDASNATMAVISVSDENEDGGRDWKNASAMLGASGISVVDVINYATGRSVAESGGSPDQKGKPFYSANASAGPGLTVTRAREILAADPVLSKAVPFIDIRNSKDGVPEGAEPFGEEGYYHNGRITLFADNIRATGSMSAEERLKWVAFHEVTHRGVANLAESQAYLSELERAGKNPYVKNLAKKIYEARQGLDEKYHVSMEVATEEALAEINAALRTGNVKQIKEQYGLHFPLSIRPRAKSAASRFIEAVKRIINRMFGRGLTDAQVENLLRRTNDAGMTPDGGPGRGKDYDAAVFSLADNGDGSPTESALAEARRQLDEQLAIADRMIAERGGLFAPNGQPSKLNRHQWAQVRTANFKQWFGDWEGSPANSSKVVDANGEPLVVYHGTTAMGFNEFKPKSAEAYGLGSYFASDRTMPEEEFGADGHVIEAFLNIRNPSDGSMPKIRKNSEALKKLRQSRPRFRGDEYDAFEEYGDFRGEAIREAGHDGIIAENDEYETELVVFKPNQIKSATGNNGDFSADTADIRYSPSPKDWITEQGRITKRVLSKEVAQRDLTPWQKTLGTQLNAALKNPAFKKVYDLTQRLIQHVNNDAYDSLNAAPDVLSRLEDWNDYKRDIANTAKEAGAALTLQKSKRRKDMAAAAEVLFEGTRFDKKVYSDKELDAFKLTADQKEIYRQARAAIDKSVGNAGKSQALNVAMNAEAINWATVERLVNLDLDPEVLFSEVSDLIDTRIAATKMEAENSTNEAEIKKLGKQVDKLVAALASIDEIQAIVDKSATEGYAPLMRWGKYTVAVIDPVDGKTLRFHMLESKREQAALELRLREKYGAANVVGGVLDEGKFEQFKGITPETVALFASVTGMDQDAAYQEYLKLAIPGRSALKRKIHRKGDMGEGIEGFSTDLPRVLSSFVLSNARKSARDLYRGPVNDAIEDISAGGVAEKARELAKFVMEPDENDWSVGIRNMLFVWNMGASVAFGVLNLSQPWMMTMPWLSQFRSPTEVAGIMGRAAKLAAAAQASGKAPKGYEAEYDRAVREGIVDPQNVFMLQGVERGKSGVGSNIWRNVAHGMGLIAAATESLNRKLTLIAALDVARAKGDAWLKSKGFADAYDFAARAVAETQGIYNKGNRPAWARSPVGAVLLVFKQYAINWVEMAGRMASNHYGDDRYRKGFWMLIGALFMMAGGMGLPFADDLIDLIETGMSWAGKPVNVERQMQMALGKDLYEPLMYGPVNSLLFNAAGADMFGRMSMGNMIPATAIANPGLTPAARSDEAIQALGAGAGLASKFMDAYNLAAAGKVGQAAITASPRAVTSVAKAVEMATTGEYKDSKGRNVRDVTPAEALIKGLDLQPASVARIQRERGRRFKDEAIQAQARTEIRNELIDAYEAGDQDAIDAANTRLRTWNAENPLYPVHINRRTLRKSVRERGKNWSARDEAAKGMEWMNDWIPESSK